MDRPRKNERHCLFRLFHALEGTAEHIHSTTSWPPSTIMTLPKATEFYLSETPHERERRIRELFDTLDRSKTGHLDSDAIRKGFTQMTHLPARVKYVHELLERCDTSKDGLVDYEEFRSYVNDKERELWQLFKGLDRSGDGRLSPDDLEVALKKSGIEITKDEFTDFMQLMDLGILAFIHGCGN